MGKLAKEDKRWLEEKFGTRVNFRLDERILYSHDIASIPLLFSRLIGATIPEAVVQPESEEELISLVRWATERKIPLIPRGKGTSGYGGVIPIKGGIVVDFYRLRRIISIDKEKQTVTVEPGLSWEQLDRELKKEGLTLRLYPTSYPSSTPGGWLAQGGAGIGSYEYGWFDRQVVSARIVLPAGEVREVTGSELEIISEAEGITGLISQVTFYIQPDEELEVLALACPDPHSLENIFKEFIARQLPLWSVTFINPRMAEMKNRAPLRLHHGQPAEARVILPAAYIATIAFRQKDEKRIKDEINKIMASCQGELLSPEIARHEWANRFNLMIVKRLGPSLVPAEVVVPLEKLGEVMEEIEASINQPLVKEGVIIRQGRNGQSEAVLLGFIPSDQRRFSYNFVFGLVLTVIKIAEKYGGRPYSTGLYFGAKAARVLGGEKREKIRAFKKQIDPHNILNPGKVLGNRTLDILMTLLGSLEALIRPFGNVVTTRVGERIEKEKAGLPADVVWYAYACSQCGYCVDECDQFYGRGWESQSPRGKWYWLREYMAGKVKWNQFMVDTFLVCTTCELCNLRCSASLPIEPSWMKLRGKLVHEDRQMTFPPFEIMAAALRSQGDIWAGYRRHRSDWFPQELRAKHGPGRKSENVYFAGCTASYVEKDIAQASVTLLDAAGIDFTYIGQNENCCGTPMLVAGKWDVFEETMRHNLEQVKACGASTVITSCPACDMMWRHVYPQWARKLGLDYPIKTKHYSELVAEKIRSGEFRFSHEVKATVTWHDSCHIGRVSGVYEEPREIIKAIPGVKFVEMPFHREEAHCCGSVLTLIKEPPVAAEVGRVRLEEALEVKADSVLALCPCCEFQFRVTREKKQLPLEIKDLATFACQGLGKNFSDPSPEVQRQWAVFEKMIALMTPEGLADLMDSMWPELLAAMPLGLGKMMHFLGKSGLFGQAAFGLMKPLFPFLFPRLLPGMMPKVFPVMLRRIEARIPMPDYMKEQMPELLPKVMDNLMPKMLPMVVPLVVPRMIAYLQR
jgi:Fe-S oxidoreductase/FAD/FMN-containing dehydrogenase